MTARKRHTQLPGYVDTPRNRPQPERLLDWWQRRRKNCLRISGAKRRLGRLQQGRAQVQSAASRTKQMRASAIKSVLAKPLEHQCSGISSPVPDHPRVRLNQYQGMGLAITIDRSSPHIRGVVSVRRRKHGCSNRRRQVSRRDRSQCMKPVSDQAGLQDHPVATLHKQTRNEDEKI